MMNEDIKQRIMQLYEVEKLSYRQIAKRVGIDRTTIAKIIKTSGAKVIVQKTSILDPYRALIGQWYKEYPDLKGTQVYDRLQSYGFNGSCSLVTKYTRSFRKKKRPAYHALEFLPGEEAQIDWLTVTGLSFGKVYGFIFVLSYSRFAWGRFYPRNSFEFFLAGHKECFQNIQGIPHRCRYDNLKSVIISRDPQTKYNPQFLDFSRFYGFSIYVCNPYSAHEKGRVERFIRDIRSFLYGNTFNDLGDMNRKFYIWLEKRNNIVHRVTSKRPQDALKEERLLPFPAMEYQAGKIITTTVSPTGFVEFDTNKYSVPDTCSSMKAQLIVYPDKIIAMVGSSRVATHRRCFLRGQKIENPLHREYLLNSTPKFKYQRILQLMKNMDPSIATFIAKATESGEDEIEYAYQLFKLLKLCSRTTLINCIHKACTIKAFRLKAIFSLLHLPPEKHPHPVFPKNTSLLNINYQNRRLEDYDRFI